MTCYHQVHDELVLEADPSVVKEAGVLLQTCMEKAVSLLGMVFKKLVVFVYMCLILDCQPIP